MRNLLRTLYQRLTSNDIWRRAVYLMRCHDPGEVTRIEKEDYLPFAIGVILTVLAMVVVGTLVWLIVALFSN